MEATKSLKVGQKITVYNFRRKGFRQRLVNDPPKEYIVDAIWTNSVVISPVGGVGSRIVAKQYLAPRLIPPSNGVV